MAVFSRNIWLLIKTTQTLKLFFFLLTQVNVLSMTFLYLDASPTSRMPYWWSPAPRCFGDDEGVKYTTNYRCVFLGQTEIPCDILG
jgi:hypothetical protein